MPEVEGHVFATYVYQEWPKFVRNSDGGHLIARNQEEVEEFLKDDPTALKAHLEDQRLLAEIRAESERQNHMFASLQEEIEQKQAELHAHYAEREWQKVERVELRSRPTPSAEPWIPELHTEPTPQSAEAKPTPQPKPSVRDSGKAKTGGGMMKF